MHTRGAAGVVRTGAVHAAGWPRLRARRAAWLGFVAAFAFGFAALPGFVAAPLLLPAPTLAEGFAEGMDAAIPQGAASHRSTEPPPRAAPPQQATPLNARQAGYYQNICASCHAEAQSGVPQTGDAAAFAARAERGFESLVAGTVNGMPFMPPLGSCSACSEADLRALVAYVSGVPDPSAAAGRKAKAQP